MAMAALTQALGSGPFKMVESTTRKVYRGRPIEPEHRIAVAEFGLLQIELIQPVSGSSLYTEFLEEHGQGVHHLGVGIATESEYQSLLTHLERSGFPPAQSGRREDLAYDYVNTEKVLGTYLELVWHRPSEEPGTAQPTRS
jgi:hypothetical protein